MLSTTKQAKTWVSDLFGLTFFIVVFYSLFIGSYALFTPDEGRYSEVAREMVASGDFITPRVNGVPFLDKPVLYYWLQASAIYLFGVKEWALRLWPALFGVFGCLMVYVTGRQFFSRRAGILSALILATSSIYYGAAHYANLDLEVAVLISTCLCFSILGLQNQHPKHRHLLFLGAYIFAGLAALTKGLIGIVFPGMIIGAWILLLNRWSQLKTMHILSGLAIFAVITIPWYMLAQRDNPAFFNYFFIDQQVSRFLTHGEYNNKTAAWFYIPIVLAGSFPWSLFAFQAIGNAMASILKNRQQHAVELFLLLWFFIIFIFFSIPASKTIGYIIPVFPVLALIVGRYLDLSWDRFKSKSFSALNGIFILLCLLIASISIVVPKLTFITLQPELIPYLQCNAVLFFVMGFLATLTIKTEYPIRKTFLIFFALTVSGLLLLASSATYLNEKSTKPLILILQKISKPEDEIATYQKYYQDLPIYLGKRISVVTDWHSPDIIYNDNWRRELWYGMSFQAKHDWLLNEKDFWPRWSGKKRLFVLMSHHDFKEFKNKSKIKVFNIAQYHDVVLVSNKN